MKVVLETTEMDARSDSNLPSLPRSGEVVQTSGAFQEYSNSRPNPSRGHVLKKIDEKCELL